MTSDLLTKYRDWFFLALGCGVGGLISYFIGLIVVRQTEKKKVLTVDVVGRGIWIETTPEMPFTISDSSGTKIRDVYALSIRVWNRGNDAIFGTDISDQHPLMISIEQSARVLGQPRIFKPNPMMTFDVRAASSNRFMLDFDCLNPGEWALVNFFTTGEGRPAIFTSGRLHGQNAHLQVRTDDSIVSWPRRIGSLSFVLSIALSPVALVVALVWAYRSHLLFRLLTQNDSVPTLLAILLFWGTAIPVLYGTHSVSKWLQRKRNPKGYPIPADVPGLEHTSLKVFLLEAIKGVRFAYSNSLHDDREIVPYSNPHENRKTTSKSQGDAANAHRPTRRTRRSENGR